MSHLIIEFANPQAAIQLSNKHIPVNSKGIELVVDDFIEEPLEATAKHDYS